MKTLSNLQYRWIVLVIALTCVLAFPFTGAAQEPSEADEDNTTPDGTIVTFSELGFSDQLIYSPHGNQSYSFALPAEWQIRDDIVLNLRVQGFVEGNPFSIGEDNSIALLSDDPAQIAIIEPTFNQTTLTPIIFPLQGNQTMLASLPLDAVTQLPAGNKHQLDLVFETAFECRGDRTGGLLISDNSYFVIPNEQVMPTLNLRQLPYPFFQQTFMTDEVVLVVPDTRESAVMGATFNVAAALGRMTHNALNLRVVSFEALSEDLLADNHLIFVGHPANFLSLDLIDLPLPPGDNGFDLGSDQQDDGILQLAPSPWNPTKAVLLVTGNTEAGIRKASQALGTGELRTSVSDNLAYISDISQTITRPSNTIAVEFDTQTLRTYGTNVLTYEFDIPPGYDLNLNTNLQLLISHSTLIDYSRSGLSAELNGIPLGTTRFSDESANASLQSFAVAKSLFNIPGQNQLTLKTTLAPLDPCSNLDEASIWLSILEESSFSVPIAPATVEDNVDITLSTYPAPFIMDPSLGSTSFVLSQNDPSSWNTAAQIASNLGAQTADIPLEINVLWEDQTEAAQSEQNLIVVGRASNLPIVDQLSDVLPIPFVEGTDFADEANLSTAYRIPESKELGYLEIIPSPFDSQATILTVLGTSDPIIERAAQALTNRELRESLNGNIAIIDGEQVALENIGDEVALEDIADIDTEDSDIQFSGDSTTDDELTWIPLFIAATSVIVLILLAIFVGIPAFSRR